ncbi:MAG: hypothetical protein NC397_07340 [Clostridium sp.]|nr:hypothetical protein [Clostridium sp.]
MKNKILQGADGINFELQMAIVGLENINTPIECLKNELGNNMATINCYGGKLSVYVNLPQSIRPTNVKPFQMSDCSEIEMVRNMVIEYIKLYLRKHFKMKYSDELLDKLTVTKMECNVTVQCKGKCKPSDVINLFDKSFSRVHLYKEIKGNTEKTYNKSELGIFYLKPHEWRLKVYDKTYQQEKIGNTQVEPNLIRVEFVFLDRALNRMYSNNRSIENILTKESLIILMKQYQITLNEIYKDNIKEMLKGCKEDIYNNLINAKTGKEISETLIACKEYVVDIEVLRAALKKWYENRNIADNSKSIISYYKKKNYGIPVDVLKTLKAIRQSANN